MEGCIDSKFLWMQLRLASLRPTTLTFVSKLLFLTYHCLTRFNDLRIMEIILKGVNSTRG